MTPPSKQEIANEIKALEKLKPIGRFANKTKESIQLQIDALKNDFDQTSDEWLELTEEQQQLIQDTDDWKNGFNKIIHSLEWGDLCE